MLNYMADIKPLEDLGLSDAEIASAVASKTSHSVPCDQVKIELEESGLVTEDPVTGARSGSLIDFYQSLGDSESKSLLGWFISHVFGRGSSIATDEYPRCLQVSTVMDSLPAEMQPVAAAVVALGGGRPRAGTVEADIIAGRDQYNAEQAEQAAEQEIQDALNALELRYITQYNEKIAPLIDARTITEADWIAAIQLMAAEF